MVLLLAVAATVFYLFNSGQLVQEKIRLTNTADAVVYSAGAFEARVLNYDAYTNRAIVANSIAVGQAVGLASWAKYMGTSADTIGPYLYLIPYAGPALSAAMAAMSRSGDAFTIALAGAVFMHDGAIQSLMSSQLAVHGPGNSIALVNRQRVMDEVARLNDPDVTVDLVPLRDDFAGFTRRYTSEADRRRMGRLVHDSRDTFLRSRNWSFGLVVLCNGVELRKRGSTELIDLVDGWKSMDTLSAHHHRVRRWRCRRNEVPIGFGSAPSKNGLDDSGISYAGSRPTNPRASWRADSSEGIANGFNPAPPNIGGGAIPPFHELSESALRADDPRTSLTVRVTKNAAEQRYSGGSSTVQPQGRLELYQGAAAGGRSAAIARAEVYFERPDGNNRLHNKHELGSLFNPYWQVRLAPVGAGERLAAQLLQGRALP